MEKKSFGRYIVSDPEICHGKHTFKGTRVLVSQVLEMVADGTDWETIVQQFHGSFPRKAIADAIRQAGKAFAKQVIKYRKEALARQAMRYRKKPLVVVVRSEMSKEAFGKYIVADAAICHGKLTFKGTRMLLADVLELVAQGFDWKTIVRECHDSIPKMAIGDAIRFAGRAFAELAKKYQMESVVS